VGDSASCNGGFVLETSAVLASTAASSPLKSAFSMSSPSCEMGEFFTSFEVRFLRLLLLDAEEFAVSDILEVFSNNVGLWLIMSFCL
jgi:hypothetical protein